MISPDAGVKFENVAGIDEAKEEIGPSDPRSFPVFEGIQEL